MYLTRIDKMCGRWGWICPTAMIAPISKLLTYDHNKKTMKQYIWHNIAEGNAINQKVINIAKNNYGRRVLIVRFPLASSFLK